ncbi:hypothetical protein [Gymnodinialimonas sp.]
MRKLPLLGSAILLAAAPVAAQDFDPDLTQCLARTYIALEQAEGDIETASDTRVAEFAAMLESTSSAISHMVAQRSNCTRPFEEMIAAIQAAHAGVVAEFQAHLATSGDVVATYAETILEPMRACHQAIGQETIEAANADRLTNGYACGWGQ